MPAEAKTNEFTVPTADKTLVSLAHRIAVAYSSSRVRLLSVAELRKATISHDIDAINKIIATVPEMSKWQRRDFCDAFVGEDMAGLDLATPMILAGAYRSIIKRVEDKEEGQEKRLRQIEKRIDDLSADFANSGGVVVSQKEWPLINISNIADVYEGFGAMLDERMAYINAKENPEKNNELKKNKKQIDDVIAEYDEKWNLKNLGPEDAKELSKRWDELYTLLKHAELSSETKQRLSKYKFLDNRKQLIRQFVSGKRKDKEKYAEYEDGYEIDKEGRLASIIELARHDVVKKHVMDLGAPLDKRALERELNETVLTKIFEIYSADQIVNNAIENPDVFAKSPMEIERELKKAKESGNAQWIQELELQKEVYDRLSQEGGEISDVGYNAAIEEQCNATAGWASRIKSKIGRGSSEVGSFWGKIFHPISHIDKFADIRLSRRIVDKREKGIERIVRMLKGLKSSLIFSVLLTGIITAVATYTGMPAATIMAGIGITLSIGVMGNQIYQWRKAQKEADLPTDIREFFRDRRLWLSLLTSVLAITTMSCGAGGFTEVARKLGVCTLVAGGYNNADAAYVDARDAKMSKLESIALAIGNAGSVIFGALTGRWLAHWFIDIVNSKLAPHNTWFQNEELVADEQDASDENQNLKSDIENQKVPEEEIRTRTVTNYTDRMLRNSETAVTHWYQKIYPHNWHDMLAQDIKAVEQYNFDTDSNMDPYRALRIIRMANPDHFAYTDAWMHDNNVTQEQVNLVKNAISNGVYDPAGMKEVSNFDAHHLGASGEIGAVKGHEVRPGDLYRPIQELPTQTIETYKVNVSSDVAKAPVESAPINDTTATTHHYSSGSKFRYVPVQDKGGVLTVGDYTPRARKTQLGLRLGSFFKRVQNELHGDNKKNEENEDTDKKVLTSTTEQQNTEVSTQLDANVDFVPPRLDQTEPVEIASSNDLPTIEEPNLEKEDYLNKSWFTPVPGTDSTVPVTDTGAMPEGAVKLENIDLEEPMFKPLSTNDEVNTERYLKTLRQRFAEQEETSGRITYSKIKKWDDLHTNLGRIQLKRENSALGASDAAELRSQEQNIIYQIKKLYNEFGRPTEPELKELFADTLRREYKLHMLDKPDEYSKNFAEWAKKHEALIKTLNIHSEEDLLTKTDLYTTTSIKDFLEQKRLENEEARKVAQRAKQAWQEKELVRQELEHARFEAEEARQKSVGIALDRAYSLLNRDRDGNHFVSDTLMRIANEPDIVSKPLTKINKVSTKLVDLTGHGNPITQNDGRAMVVVDIDGLRIPFFLANGTETDSREIPGKWYPMFTVMHSGEWLLSQTRDFLNNEKDFPEIAEIADALNNRIGDIRNYRDPSLTSIRKGQGKTGFVGGVDAFDPISPEDIFDVVNHSPRTITKLGVWGTYPGENLSLSIDPDDLKWYLAKVAEIGTPQRNRFFKELFEGGIGNIRDNARKMIHRRRMRNDYYYGHE